LENRDIDEPVKDWVVPFRPLGDRLEGRYAILEPLSSARHSAALHAENSADSAIWDYLPYGPFSDEHAYMKWAISIETGHDPLFFAICDKERGRWAGVASYLRINPEAGPIEVGHINFAKSLQRSRAATEAMYLMMKWAFEAGYRRYEWKCNASNLASRRAAERLGLSYEGIFRQALIVKGRNRDTAWFAAIDKEWPSLQAAFETWLAPDNFDDMGRQIQRLSTLTSPILVSRDPALG
jgi:RimJ/RimL family protein N-acetyltransferase